MTNIKSYQASFQLLVSDLQCILEFVEPTDANGAAYSHRIYELFLRACTKFESLCKDLLVSAGAPKAPSKMNLGDYRGLETSLKLEPVKALVLYWRPQPWETQPFSGWVTAKPPLLRWYADYHKVKHNRQSEFHKANLSTVTVALAGLFVLLAKVAPDSFPDAKYSLEDTYHEFWASLFGMRWPR